MDSRYDVSSTLPTPKTQSDSLLALGRFGCPKSVVLSLPLSRCSERMEGPVGLAYLCCRLLDTIRRLLD